MDPLMMTGWAGLSTFVWGLVAATLWIVRRRAPPLSLAMAGASMVLFLVCALAIPPGYNEDEFRRIKGIHAEFAPVLEQYRHQHGTYPPTLEHAGITTPRTRYGPLRYSATVNSAGVCHGTTWFSATTTTTALPRGGARKTSRDTGT